MDKRLLIGFGGFLAVFLLFPFVAQYMREGQLGGAETAAQTGKPNSAAKMGRDRIPNDPPLLNTQNLIGTEWQVEWENYKIKVTIAPNRVCYATHPLMRSVTGMDYFEGRWTMLDFDKILVEARFDAEHFERELIISGNDLYDLESGNKILRY